MSTKIFSFYTGCDNLTKYNVKKCHNFKLKNIFVSEDLKNNLSIDTKLSITTLNLYSKYSKTLYKLSSAAFKFYKMSPTNPTFCV